MELWIVTFAAIVAIAALRAVVARRRQPAGPERSLWSLLAVRLEVVVVVTALVAIARIVPIGIVMNHAEDKAASPIV